MTCDLCYVLAASQVEVVQGGGGGDVYMCIALLSVVPRG